MGEPEDVFASFAPALARARGGNPWAPRPPGDTGGTVPPRFVPDDALLAGLLAIPLGEGRAPESGRLAKAIDAWVASELRRAGFPPDEIWPRLDRPRVLPREVGLLLERLPPPLRAAVRAHLLRAKSVAPGEARVLGRAYVKQVDVLLAQWARGPELLVSTKSMLSSFRNNLANRFEEAYGDAKNLRGRYPLAAMGFLFLLRGTVLDEPGTFEKAVDMLRKLRAESDIYDATCLVLVDWRDDSRNGHETATPGNAATPAARPLAASQPPGTSMLATSPVAPTARTAVTAPAALTAPSAAPAPSAVTAATAVAAPSPVTVLTDRVPVDLRADRFLDTLVAAVLDRTPVDMHVEVRQRREHRSLALAEVDGTGDEEAGQAPAPWLPGL